MKIVKGGYKGISIQTGPFLSVIMWIVDDGS